jgi:hypothetical protein
MQANQTTIESKYKGDFMLKIILSLLLSSAVLASQAMASSSPSELEPVEQAESEDREMFKAIQILWMEGVIAFHEAVFALAPCEEANEECGRLEKVFDSLNNYLTEIVRGGATVGTAMAAKAGYNRWLLGLLKKRWMRIGTVAGGGSFALYAGINAGDIIEDLRGLTKAEQEEVLDNLRKRLALLKESTSIFAIEKAQTLHPELYELQFAAN